jgi:hypothetical protein
LKKYERRRLKMRNIIIKTVGSLFICLVFTAPIHAAVNKCECSPKEWDFGDVLIGSSSAIIFTLINVDLAEAAIRNIWIVNATSDSFKILINVPPPSIYIPIERTYEVAVEFSPTIVGQHSAELQISRDANYSDIFIPIEGVGVLEELPPGKLMSDLINSFNKFLEDQTIKISGPSRTALSRLKVFRNMLKASSDLINWCNYETACTQLVETLNRIDGNKYPPDFIEGKNSEIFASMIRDAINQLE